MAQTLRSILDDVAAYLDKDTSLATGTELTVRVNLINQSLREWGDAYQWNELRFNQAVTVSFSQSSVGLPATFKKLMSPPWNAALTSDNTYIQINPSDRIRKLATDRYSYVVGDEAKGYALMINPPLPSGVSLMLDYQAYPSSMATLQDISVCPQPEYLTKRTIALVLESRADTRFPQLKADADRMLRTMIEEQDAPSGGENNRVPDFYSSTGFRIGQ